MLLALRDEIGFYDPYDLGDAGDRRANNLILDRLREHRPDDAVLSEEAADDLARVRADRVWIVDPVDGTREFSHAGPHRLGRAHRAVAAQRRRAARRHHRRRGRTARRRRGVPHRHRRQPAAARSRVPSASPPAANRPPTVLWWLRDILDVELVGIGSAGAKAMAVVRGDVDAYVHAGGQWEWDSAAPAGVVLAAGLHASRLDGSPLLYNRVDPYLPDFVMCRPELADTLLEAHPVGVTERIARFGGNESAPIRCPRRTDTHDRRTF